MGLWGGGRGRGSASCLEGELGLLAKQDRPVAPAGGKLVPLPEQDTPPAGVGHELVQAPVLSGAGATLHRSTVCCRGSASCLEGELGPLAKQDRPVAPAGGDLGLLPEHYRPPAGVDHELVQAAVLVGVGATLHCSTVCCRGFASPGASCLEGEQGGRGWGSGYSGDPAI